MFVSTFLITAFGTFITEKIIEPRLGKYEGENEIDMTTISEEEKKRIKSSFSCNDNICCYNGFLYYSIKCSI